jgi:GNAT superfamily N-acetyltransferase
VTIAQASHSIRRLNPADATAYRALRLRALQEHPEAFTSSFEEEEAKPLHWSLERLNTPNARFWGAFSAAATARTQTQLQGMIGLQSETRQQNRHKATVVGMYVAPEVARQGLAKALLWTKPKPTDCGYWS